MKIAFDVKGTLDGNNEAQLRRLFRKLHAAGHTLFIWSNSIGYAFEMSQKMEAIMGEPFPAERVLYKYSIHDAELEEGLDIMDVAFEDDPGQTYLAARHLLFVHELPKNDSEVLALVESFQEKK